MDARGRSSPVVLLPALHDVDSDPLADLRLALLSELRTRVLARGVASRPTGVYAHRTRHMDPSSVPHA